MDAAIGNKTMPEVILNGGARQYTRSSASLIVCSVLFALVIAESHAQAVTGSPAGSQPVPNDQAEIAEELLQPGEVVIDGRVVLRVYQRVGSYTPQERAEKITDRVLAAAQARVPPESVVIASRATWTEISAGGNLMLVITDEDARLAGKSREQLALETAEGIRQALTNYRRDHAWGALLRGILFSGLATLLLLLVLLIARRLRLTVHAHVNKWIEDRTNPDARRTAVQLAGTYLLSTIFALGSVLRWLTLIALFEIYLTVLLSFFVQTRSVSHAVTTWIFSALRVMGQSVLAYLPNLFVIAVVVIIASQVFRLIARVFHEIAKGSLPIKNFYPEWAEPTAKLVRVGVLVLVLIIIFPYLPGSKSPAFQGISIFVGVLLSLGSSSAVANAIAGIILTYMRSFSVGDWVRIGETVGEVKERNLLVTRILTPKQETITIPNATVMNGSVMNFTREAKNSGVIFHTTVTIGYDAPWKIVHQLLLNAASATEHILRNPGPFVLQTELNDFYVSYELNAYTDTPTEMQFIYSDLHQNIQDKFNEAGVEICSPHFASLRDGNTIAIPSQYVGRDYVAPGFRVDRKEKEREVAEPMRK